MAVASTTIAIAAIAVAAASAGAGAYTAVSAGKAAEASGKYNAAVQRNNALMAQRSAKFQADRIRKRNLLLMGKQRASFLKSGVNVSEDVILDSQIEGELDRMAAIYSGATTSQAYVAQAKLSEMEGRNARRAGTAGAVGSVLGGAGQALGAYGDYRRDPYFA